MKVSVIISNRNDLTMLNVTVRSCIEELKSLGSKNNVSEIVICDNSDEEQYGLIRTVIPWQYVRDGKVKVIRQDFPCLFTARETAAREASGEYLICLDSHMIVGRDMILDLVKFMDSKEDDPTLGFAHAPINWSHHHEMRAKHDRDVSQHELGPWGKAYDKPTTMTWKGMPWICRREWFLNELGGYGALAEHKISWGGGDMHIGVKPWLLGYKNWAVPCAPAIHIGPFPKIDRPANSKHHVHIGPDKYRLYGASGYGPHTFGFLVSCYVLGGEPMMLRNKPMLDKRFGRYLDTDRWWNKAKELGERERLWLDERKVMSFEEFIRNEPWNGV